MAKAPIKNLTLRDVKRVAEIMVAESVGYKAACRLAEPPVASRAITSAITGDPAGKPDWQQIIENANAQVEVVWLQKLKVAESNAEFKKCEFMLKSVRPEKYRERGEQQTGGITVNIIVAKGASLALAIPVHTAIADLSEIGGQVADVPALEDASAD